MELETTPATTDSTNDEIVVIGITSHLNVD